MNSLSNIPPISQQTFVFVTSASLRPLNKRLSPKHAVCAYTIWKQTDWLSYIFVGILRRSTDDMCVSEPSRTLTTVQSPNSSFENTKQLCRSSFGAFSHTILFFRRFISWINEPYILELTESRFLHHQFDSSYEVQHVCMQSEYGEKNLTLFFCFLFIVSTIRTVVTSVFNLHESKPPSGKGDKPLSPRMVEFKKKLQQKTPIGKLDEIEGKHPYEEKEPLPPHPNNTNPSTGEINGPRGPEPTRYGDWERKGRVSDFWIRY